MFVVSNGVLGRWTGARGSLSTPGVWVSLATGLCTGSDLWGGGIGNCVASDS